jgi:RNA polymerase sigma-70 factor, ECF subfamily
MDPDPALATCFEATRPHLRLVALRLLGSPEDADDAVQATWIKASRTPLAEVENPAGWLSTITAREALDRLRARRRRAETPVGSDELERHAPPAPAADEEVLRLDEVSRALAVVLDRLSPAQRVAYVLHEAFAVPFGQIAEVLDRSPDAAKKLASRARRELEGPPDPDPARTDDHARIVEAFLVASRTGDIATLLDLLAPDVVRTVEPVLVPAGTEPVKRGAAEVARETRRFAGRARAGVVLIVDGAPGIVIAPGGRPQIVLELAIGPDRMIHRIDIRGRERLGDVVLSLLPGHDKGRLETGAPKQR